MLERVCVGILLRITKTLLCFLGLFYCISKVNKKITSEPLRKRRNRRSIACINQQNEQLAVRIKGVCHFGVLLLPRSVPNLQIHKRPIFKLDCLSSRLYSQGWLLILCQLLVEQDVQKRSFACAFIPNDQNPFHYLPLKKIILYFKTIYYLLL